jgi:hypothetical protein
MAERVLWLVAGLVLLLLARAGVMAWRHRRVALAVWRRIRWHHVAGSLGLLVVVVATLLGLIGFVPGAGWGLGSLIGLTGNAVFAPLEAAMGGGEPAASGAAAGDAGAAASWPGMLTAVGVVVFLTALLAMFPWLAYVEERTFREGLEEAGLAEELWTALKFGLLHLIMLIPVGAALAIGVAGFAYGRIYRRAFARSREQARTEAGPFGVPVVVGPTVREARNEAVLTSTVWHATFNSLIVLTLLVSFVAGWLLA